MAKKSAKTKKSKKPKKARTLNKPNCEKVLCSDEITAEELEEAEDLELREEEDDIVR